MKKVIFPLFLIILTGSFFSCLSFGPSQPTISKAAETGDVGKIQKLLEGGADINARYYGQTPLERAAMRGKVEVVEYLLTKGAQNPVNAFKEAMSKNHYDVAKLMINSSYVDVNNNVNLFYSILDKKDIPIEQRLQTVKEIVGDKLTSPYIIALVEPENYQKTIDFFGISLTDRADAFGGSILHIAAKRNNYNLVNYLLERKFNINVLDDNNQTALFYAITYYGPSINWTNPIIEDAQTARINFVSDMPYYSNASAVQRTQVSIVTALLDSGINVNQQNKTGWTVLHFAASFYPEGLRELLISKGADQKLKTNLGRTANDILAMRR